MEQGVASREYTELGLVFHIFGLRLQFSKIGAIARSTADVVSDSKAYIDDLATGGSIAANFSPDAFDVGDGYGGRIYQSYDTPEFAEIRTYFNGVAAAIASQKMGEAARGLLDLAASDTTAFTRKLVVNNVQHAIFYDRPVLAAIPANDFVDKLLCMDANRQLDVFEALRLRYEGDSLRNTLAAERVWLKLVRNELKSRAPALRPLSKFRIEIWLKHVVVAALVRVAQADREDLRVKRTAKR